MLVSGFLMGTALSAALLIAPAYLGDKIPPAAAESFAHHDSNHNGYISLSEFLAPLSNTTNIVNVQSGTINLTADTDFSDIQGDLKEKVDQLIKSRKLKGSDFQVIAQQSLEIAQQSEADRPCREAMIAQMASRRTLEFGRLDENNDNQLSPLEFSKSSFVPKREAVHAVFNGYDADKDGVLIEAEMASVPKDRIFFFQNTVKAEQQDVVLPAACRNLMESDNLAGSDKESTVIASFQALKVPSDLSKTAENFEELDENSDEKVTLDEFLRAKGVIL
jgi:Ca2+-binding EF-hand superfamily protein